MYTCLSLIASDYNYNYYYNYNYCGCAQLCCWWLNLVNSASVYLLVITVNCCLWQSLSCFPSVHVRLVALNSLSLVCNFTFWLLNFFARLPAWLFTRSGGSRHFETWVGVLYRKCTWWTLPEKATYWKKNLMPVGEGAPPCPLWIRHWSRGVSTFFETSGNSAKVMENLGKRQNVSGKWWNFV